MTAAVERVRLLRRHLVEKVPVSQVCEEVGIQPTQFYRWQQTFFENGAAAFERPNGRPKSSSYEQQGILLECKIQRKDDVQVELMEESTSH